MSTTARPRGVLRASPNRGAAVAILITGASLFGHGCASRTGERFNSPEEAGAALAAALSPFDEARLRKVLGPGSDDVIASGDPVADRNAGDAFAQSFKDHHEAAPNEDGSVTLVVGVDRWPLPIPLQMVGDSWQFDAEAGREEILDRRIGRNELAAIEVCLAMVDAQREYYDLDPDGDGVKAYAPRFRSETGTRNGLYWPPEPGGSESPLGPLASAAAADGYEFSDPKERTPFHGYFYRILTSQGASAPGGARDYTALGRLTSGFAVIAWPAEYENSGIMTFLVGADGVVFHRDLGPDTASTAGAMRAYDPGPEWDLAR
jgi:hypothetical protein